jgi:hypothetical protein
LDKKYRESKRFVVRGLLSLVGGSALLLAYKLLGLPDLVGTLTSFAGSCFLLYGHACIIYGLLIFAGDQEPE